MQLSQWVESIARLCIAESSARLQPEPKIRELVGEVATLRAVDTFRIPAAHNEGSRVFFVSLQKLRDLLRIVLTIAIERDGIGKAHIERFTKSGLQSRSLTTVLWECHKRDTLDSTQYTCCSICAAIVYHNHIVTLCKCLLHHTTNGSVIIICRNHHTDTPITE